MHRRIIRREGQVLAAHLGALGGGAVVHEDGDLCVRLVTESYPEKKSYSPPARTSHTL